MSKLLSLLYFSYPLIVHLGIYTEHLVWALLWLSCLLLLSAIREIICRQKLTSAFVIYLVLGVGVGVLAGSYPETLAKFIPLLIYTSMFALFATSLIPGKTPLITRFAALIRGENADALTIVVQQYTRKVTQLWAASFMFLGLISLLLALYAPVITWSLFTNVISYIILILLFVLEYGARKRLVGEHMDYSIKEFVERLLKVDFRSIFRPTK